MNQDTLICAKPIPSDSLKSLDPGFVAIKKDARYQTFPSTFLQVSKKLGDATYHRKEVSSFFTSHLLKTNNIRSEKIPETHKDWICITLLLVSALFIWTKVLYTRRIKQVMNGLYATRYISQQTREKWALSHSGSLGLFFVFIFTLSLLAFLIIDENNSHIYNWLFYIKITGVIMGIYFANFLLIKLIGNLLSIKKEINEYITQIFVINEFQGMVFLPITIIIAYVEILKNPLLYISLIILIFMYLFRLVRGVSIISSYSKFSKFYLFLYFCSLEILPMLIIVKVLMKSLAKN